MVYCPAEAGAPRGSGSPEKGARALVGALALCLMRDSRGIVGQDEESYIANEINWKSMLN